MSNLLNANSQYISDFYKWMELNQSEVYNTILPYISAKYSIKRVMPLVNKRSTFISNFEIKKKVLLTDMEFGSIVSNGALDISTALDKVNMALGLCESDC